MDDLNSAPSWWVTAIVLPVMGAASLLMWRWRDACDERIDGLEHRLDVGLAQAREALAAYKLEVAKSYATTGYLKDVETRLTEHLLRIERKIETTREN